MVCDNVLRERWGVRTWGANGYVFEIFYLQTWPLLMSSYNTVECFMAESDPEQFGPPE